MLPSESEAEVRHYLEDGLSAMENMDDSLRTAGASFADVQSCLDLPCGYGRVTRHLRERVEPSRITASDVDRQAVRFCAHEFGVKPLVAHADPKRTVFPTSYDLIFVGSLLTHLRPEAGLELLDVLVRVLKVGGLVVFSTHGETCLSHMDWYGEEFSRAEAVYRAEVARVGVCFLPYPARRHYGITIHAKAYVETVVAERFGSALVLVRFKERGWDSHQDVWSYRRA